MDFSIILLLVFFAYRNSMRARQKDQNPVLWGLLTVVLFLVGSFIGIVIVFMSILKDSQLDLNKINSKDPKYAKDLAEQVSVALQNNPIHSVTILLFGLGGYLLVRYIIEKKPEKKKNLDLWPDQENAQ